MRTGAVIVVVSGVLAAAFIVVSIVMTLRGRQSAISIVPVGVAVFVALFCVYGVVATLEPGNRLAWRVGYITVGIVASITAVVLCAGAFGGNARSDGPACEQFQKKPGK